MAARLSDRGAIETSGPDDPHWTFNAEKLNVERIPPTRTGVLQARLDHLPAAERETLQEASVIGQVFWDQALISMDARAKDTLPSLVRRELALPRSELEVIEGLREYAFHHHILHQVTYDTVISRIRRELHAKVGRWLADFEGGRANDFLGMAADHFECAGDLSSAAEYHARAAGHSQQRYAHDAALASVQRSLIGLALAQAALDLTRSTQARDLEVRALICIAEAEMAFGRATEAAWACEQAQSHAREIGELSGVQRAAIARARVALAQNDLPAAFQHLQGFLDGRGPPSGRQSSGHIELLCYQVLARMNDVRADKWLALAYRAVSANADAINGVTIRSQFLNNVPHNRDTLGEWSKKPAASAV